MSSCILFACSIAEGREFVLENFLDSFVKNHYDSDIYVGINPSENRDRLKDIINRYPLKTYISYVNPNQYSDSDASAFQVNLKLLLDSGKKYDNYWFIHTKSGFNSHSDYLRQWYIDNFISRRIEIENFFKQNSNIGSYGILGLEYNPKTKYINTDVEIDLWKDNITEQLPCTHAKFFYIHTIYCITHEPIQKFFSLVTEEWFSSKLDRYYFEGVFPFIVSRSGYFPYLENRMSLTGNDLLYCTIDWVRENNLEDKYKALVDLFKTNYTFHQLQPPYVNSNTKSQSTESN